MTVRKVYRVEFPYLMYRDLPVYIGVYQYALVMEHDHELVNALAKHEPSAFDKQKHSKRVLPTSYRDRRPGPREDPGLREFTLPYQQTKSLINNWYFGFDSIEQLKAWFYDREELEILSARYFAVGVYRAEQVKYGLRQVLFYNPANNPVTRTELSLYDTCLKDIKLLACAL